jgi:hypothetical protein
MMFHSSLPLEDVFNNANHDLYLYYYNINHQIYRHNQFHFSYLNRIVKFYFLHFFQNQIDISTNNGLLLYGQLRENSSYTF